jgi:hypothetical protein
MKHIIMTLLITIPLLAASAAYAASGKGNAWPALPDVDPVKDNGCRVVNVAYPDPICAVCPETGLLTCEYLTEVTMDCGERDD